MSGKFYKNEKFQKVFYPTLYFLLTIGFVFTGCFLFNRTYYTNVYVSGSSMMPTLYGGGEGSGNRYHYGISDNHRRTIRQLKRFDVAITYYPEGWVAGMEDTVYKIKRVWGFPGETLKMTFADNTYHFSVTKGEKEIYKVDGNVSEKTFTFEGESRSYIVSTFDVEHKSFNTRVSTNNEYFNRTNFEITLSEEKQEYFLMGDNWVSSSDSYTHLNEASRITFDNIQGKVIRIQGTARYENGNLVDKRKIKEMYYF